jgi:hypothetical protein
LDVVVLNQSSTEYVDGEGTVVAEEMRPLFDPFNETDPPPVSPLIALLEDHDAPDPATPLFEPAQSTAPSRLPRRQYWPAPSSRTAVAYCEAGVLLTVTVVGALVAVFPSPSRAMTR